MRPPDKGPTSYLLLGPRPAVRHQARSERVAKNCGGDRQAEGADRRCSHRTAVKPKQRGILETCSPIPATICIAKAPLWPTWQRAWERPPTSIPARPYSITTALTTKHSAI